MTEQEAIRWVTARWPDRIAKIGNFVDLVKAENSFQNLIAPSTIEHIWVRHVVDSLQLIRWSDDDGLWVDIGSGGGFPGLLIGLARTSRVMLVEPRRKRARFLMGVVDHLSLSNVELMQCRAETLREKPRFLSARAVADIDRLIDIGRNCATPTTRWILPRGQITDEDMSILTRRFGAMFHVEHSITSIESKILIAQGSPH